MFPTAKMNYKFDNFSLKPLKKGLFLFLGESFRSGGQGSRIRGTPDSYNEQINACLSHMNFIDAIKKKFNLKSVSAYISTYNTQYNNNLISMYKKYLLGCRFYDNSIGINNLYHTTISFIDNIDQYDFIFYIRIDLFLKPLMSQIFDPNSDMILYPSVCFIPYHKIENNPRVNDTMIFVPKKYYRYIKDISVFHDSWHNLVRNTDLTYNDLGTILNTYHDSDSLKDFNPLYYIVNRDQSNKFHSEGHIFNKFNFK